MDRTYWHKQTAAIPLFPDVLWSRPENRAYAGKLLIVGGNLYGFAAAATAFAESEKAGIGIARVVLPNALQKTVGKLFPPAEFAPSTPSGSFNQQAFGEILALSNWADGVLLAGDLGRNSETAIMLEKLAVKYEGQLTLARDAVDYFTTTPQALCARANTLLVLSFAQLQKLAMNMRFKTAFRFEMDFLRLIDALHEFTTEHGIFIIVKHLETIFIAVNGQVCSHKLVKDKEIWRVHTAARAATWWVQNPSKPFEALTTSLLAFP